MTPQWSKQRGPGVVNFASSNQVDTTATFSSAGVYVLRLTANDSELAASDEVTITVNQAGSSNSIDVSVSTGNDDVEERGSGSMSLGSSDLELTEDGSAQTIGLRFNGVAIPSGATIIDARVQFQVDETTSGLTAHPRARHGQRVRLHEHEWKRVVSCPNGGLGAVESPGLDGHWRRRCGSADSEHRVGDSGNREPPRLGERKQRGTDHQWHGQAGGRVRERCGGR
jgi:hypothetical protein